MNIKVDKLLFYLVAGVLFLVGCSSTSYQNNEAYEIYTNAIENLMSNTNRSSHITLHQETIVDNIPEPSIRAIMNIKYINETSSAPQVEINEIVYLDEVLNQETITVYIDNICYQNQIDGDIKIQYHVPDTQTQSFANIGTFKFPQGAIKNQSVINNNDTIEIAFTLDGAIMQNEIFKKTSNPSIKMKDAEYSMVISSEGLIQSTSFSYEYTMNENDRTVINKYSLSMNVQQYGGIVIETPNPIEYENRTD